MKRYLKNYNAIYAEGMSKVEVLKDLRDMLDADDLMVFMEDILTEDRAVRRVFGDTRLLTSGERAFDWLVDSPAITLDKMQKGLYEIFKKALKNEYGEASKDVMLKINALTRLNRKGLSADAIEHLLESKKNMPPDKQKLALLITMSKIEKDKISNLGYIEEYTTKSGEYSFFSAILSSYTYNDRPSRALDFLKDIPNSYKMPDYANNYFWSETKRAVFKSLEDGVQKKAIRQLEEAIVNEDVKSIFNEVVSSREFDRFIEPTLDEILNNLSPEVLEQLRETLGSSEAYNKKKLTKETRKTKPIIAKSLLTNSGMRVEVGSIQQQQEEERKNKFEEIPNLLIVEVG